MEKICRGGLWAMSEGPHYGPCPGPLSEVFPGNHIPTGSEGQHGRTIALSHVFFENEFGCGDLWTARFDPPTHFVESHHTYWSRPMKGHGRPPKKVFYKPSPTLLDFVVRGWSIVYIYIYICEIVSSHDIKSLYPFQLLNCKWNRRQLPIASLLACRQNLAHSSPWKSFIAKLISIWKMRWQMPARASRTYSKTITKTLQMQMQCGSFGAAHTINKPSWLLYLSRRFDDTLLAPCSSWLLVLACNNRGGWNDIP